MYRNNCGRLCLVLTLAFISSCISSIAAIKPIVRPLQKYTTLHHQKSDTKLQKRHSVIPIHYEENEFYDANIKGQTYMTGFFISHFIGTPPQQINTLIDTGSSNLAIACAASPRLTTYFDPLVSSTYVRLHGFYSTAELRYADGQMGGDLAGDVEWIATVDTSVLSSYIADNVSISDLPQAYLKTVSVKFACIMYSTKGIFISPSWQGVMGMAYGSIVKPSNRYETFFDSLIQQTGLPNIFTLQLCALPTPDQENSGALRGNLIFGGTDFSLMSTEIQYTKLAIQSFYGILIADFLVNGESLGLDCSNYNDPISIIDSGTSNWLVPQAVYDQLVVALSANVQNSLLSSPLPPEFWGPGYQLCISSSDGIPWEAFPSLTLHITQNLNGSTNQVFAIVVPPSSYIRLTGTNNGQFCYSFSIHSVNSTFINSIMGLVVLEGLYLEFDRVNGQVGIAQSAKCDNDNPLGYVKPRVYGPISVDYDTTGCLVMLPTRGQLPGNLGFLIAGIVIGAVAVILLIIFVVLSQQQAYSSPYSPIGGDATPGTPQ